MGGLLGAAGQAGELAAALSRRHQRVQDLVAQASRRPRVFFQIGISPIVSAGSHTFLDELITTAGGLNLAAMYGDQLLLLKEGRRISLGAPKEALIYEQLEQAYGCALLVDENPLGKVPRVSLVPHRFLRLPDS